MGETNADLRVADLVNLKDVLEIVEVINAHTEEDELIQAVLDKMLAYEMAAVVVFRRISADGTTLIPFGAGKGDSALDLLLHTNDVPLDSYEGRAMLHDEVVSITEDNFPRVKLDPHYRDLVNECIGHGTKGALFYPVRSSEPIGTLSFYSFENLKLDERGIDMFQRGARLIAFGIEKCRRLAMKRQREIELQKANVRLESSNRDLQDFAHVASHDLQEPLRKIRTFSDRLNVSAAGRLTDQSAGDLDQIQDAAARMQRLIDDLLVFSRVSNRIGEPVALGLNAVVDTVLAANEAGLARSGATINVGALPSALVDERQMVQLFSALVDNAQKFAAQERPLIVEISGELDDGDVVIEVADNGIGFEAEHAERIFEPFRRLHASTGYDSAKYDGTGMGLAVVRRIVNRHNGTVVAASHVGGGATFTLRFPTG